MSWMTMYRSSSNAILAGIFRLMILVKSVSSMPGKFGWGGLEVKAARPNGRAHQKTLDYCHSRFGRPEMVRADIPRPFMGFQTCTKNHMRTFISRIPKSNRPPRKRWTLNQVCYLESPPFFLQVIHHKTS